MRVEEAGHAHPAGCVCMDTGWRCKPLTSRRPWMDMKPPRTTVSCAPVQDLPGQATMLRSQRQSRHENAAFGPQHRPLLYP
jgi:hypothetical protein